MVAALAFSAILCADFSRIQSAELALAASKAEALEQTSQVSRRIETERRDFELRFNRVLSAMADFEREYNASHGMVWPKKQADALKKAMHDLQLK